eukprot:TRINITY_DN80578_c2_g1_i1.p1 TRINITY_DN80578_c2_g1~~TRINITY_DN80578_c2_g1_i1.p1  ORF type:complete len:150 (+),score=8.19 TRINITY_DN80578_c2_g1_i1:3-452(+)
MIPRLSTHKKLYYENSSGTFFITFTQQTFFYKKMKVSETNKCDKCVNETDCIEHFFYTCQPVYIFWRRIETLTSSIVGKIVKLSLVDVLFGVKSNELNKIEKTTVNHILLICKMCISIARKTKSLSALQIIFDHHLQLRKPFIMPYVIN